MKDLVIRFLVGGAVVSGFAALGEVFKPKTFAGIFSAAPSVALATLALAFATQGPVYVAASARAMVPGAAAMLVYSVVVSFLCEKRNLPVMLSASATWAAWAVTAFAGLTMAHAGGWLP